MGGLYPSWPFLFCALLHKTRTLVRPPYIGGELSCRGAVSSGAIWGITGVSSHNDNFTRLFTRGPGRLIGLILAGLMVLAGRGAAFGAVPDPSAAPSATATASTDPSATASASADPSATSTAAPDVVSSPSASDSTATAPSTSSAPAADVRADYIVRFGADV